MHTSIETSRAFVPSVFDRSGHRKYLTISERNAFLAAARQMDPEVRTFCTALAFTGARISEVLALTVDRVDIAAGVIIIESLKKRRRGVFRAIPVPSTLMDELLQVHHLKSQMMPQQHLWTWGRTMAWLHVKKCMTKANLRGPAASARGLRHGLGVTALQSGVPLNLIKRWLGHARLSTTEIYVEAMGAEEASLAARYWASFD